MNTFIPADVCIGFEQARRKALKNVLIAGVFIQIIMFFILLKHGQMDLVYLQKG